VQREALAGVEVDAELAADNTRGVEDGGEPLLGLEHAVAAVGAAPHEERLLGRVAHVAVDDGTHVHAALELGRRKRGQLVALDARHAREQARRRRRLEAGRRRRLEAGRRRRLQAGRGRNGGG